MSTPEEHLEESASAQESAALGTAALGTAALGTAAPQRALALRALEAVVGPLTFRNGLSWMGLALVVLTVWWLLIQPFVIPTDSMYPTLDGDERFLRGDRIFVNKLIYGPRIPFTNTRIFHWREPQRWEIVVFRPVEKDAPHSVLVKRVVGLPGEHVEIKDGAIWANGVRMEPPEALRDVLHYTRYIGAYEEEMMRFAVAIAAQSGEAAGESAFQKMTEADIRALAGEELRGVYEKLSPWIREVATKHFEEQYPNPIKYGVLPEPAYSVVPEDSYLVCGDNSPYSGDGRIFGWLPNGHILGRASCAFWPIGRVRAFTVFWSTWMGRAVLYGIPALIVAVEVWSFVRRRRERGRAQAG